MSEGTADVARFFIEIAVAVDRGEILTPIKLKKLNHVIHALTVLSAADEEYVIDLDYAGYVKLRLDMLEIFVPFHLSKFFPKNDQLTELVRATRLLILDEMNPICISGSSTFLGAARSISDLDFCEYYVNAPRNASKSLLSKWRQIMAQYHIAKTKCLSESYAPPWPTNDQLFEEQFAKALDGEEKPSVKMDGVYISTLFGTLPASNLILLINPKEVEKGSSTKSFVFQEAVLVRAGGPPRALVNANSLGGYLNFLKNQIEEYQTTDPLKSLKRALCFFLLSSIEEPADAIIKVLQSEASELLALAKRQTDLEGLIDGAPPQFTAAVAAARSTRQVPEDIVTYATAIIRPLMEALAMDMLARVKELYAAAAL